MKSIMIAFSIILVTTPVLAKKPCEELKSEIAAKIQAKGVKNYALEIVPVADVTDQKVVGGCDGGTKKIIYKRG
ncbi:MAG: DUF1161 domain-containing protein [Stenotrophobium sp.]